MTAYDVRISDWSSDVCSSDLATQGQSILVKAPAGSQGGQTTVHASVNLSATTAITGDALFGVGTLTSIAINPNTDTKPLGRASTLFTAKDTYTPPSGTP